MASSSNREETRDELERVAEATINKRVWVADDGDLEVAWDAAPVDELSVVARLEAIARA